MFGVKQIHQYLAGRMFSIYSDHKPLQHIFAIDRPTPAMASACLPGYQGCRFIEGRIKES